jgi:hypothetical protein
MADVLVAARCLSSVEAAKHMLWGFFDGTDTGEVRNFIDYEMHRDRHNHRMYLDQLSFITKIISDAGYGLNE